ETNSDWKVIARRLKSILAADKGLAGSVDLAILRSLDAALLARKAKPGSIAALIDDLVDCRLDYVRGQWHTEPSYQKILLLGFDAVPELLEHLDDDRLTRTRQPAMGNNRGYHYRVRDVVSDLLRRLAAADPGETTDFRKWWASAQKIGEEKYLVDHVFRSQPDAKEPNAHQLWIIAEKYPWRLPEIYKTLLDRRPEWWNWSVAEAIGRSKLPRSKKVELLVSGGKQKNLHHRYAALQQLKDLDKEASIKILSDTLDHLPESTRGWMPREAWFAAL